MTRAEQRVNKRLKSLSPEKAALAADGLRLIADSLGSENTVNAYKGLIQFAIITTFGQEVPTPNWNAPPAISEKEKRYLAVITKLASLLRQGNITQLSLTVNGSHAFYGSRADSGGIPCDPELLLIYGNLCQSLNHLLQSGKLEKKRIFIFLKNNIKVVLADLIDTIVYAYRTTDPDRADLAGAVFDFHEAVDEYLLAA